MTSPNASTHAPESTVLITGAGRGLGFYLAEAFLGEGYLVFAGYRGALGPLAELRAKSGARLVPIELDVTQPSSVKAALAAVSQITPALDALVNNAAILPAEGRGTVDTMNIEIGLSVFDVNSLGPLRVTQAFLPLLRAGSRKLIVNVSSEAGSIGNCWRVDEHLYCMSKAALNMQHAILKNHLGKEGFELLAIHPGWMRTDMGGPGADIHPKEAADGMVALLRKRRGPDEPTYFDYTGAPLIW